jgi:4a-hydroxytetrahydrobiopterin dehydratase
MQLVSDGAFSEQVELEQWRVVRKCAECRFAGNDRAALAAFLTDVLEIAERTGAVADVDVRSGLVAVRLASDSRTDLTTACADAALAITSAAGGRGLTAATSDVARTEIGIDAIDIDQVLPFWRAVLAYVDEPTPPGEQVTAIVDPQRINAAVWFQQMDAPRPQRNRVHLDLNVPHDQAQARIDAAVAAGGTVLTDRWARAFWVLADPEGNEVCVCTWQDRS